MLKIQPRKTYNPLDISPFYQLHRLAYFLAGLIDGDGHIGVYPNDNIAAIRIKVHPNWATTLKEMSRQLFKLYGIDSKIRFTKEGWVVWGISKMAHISQLYNLIDGHVPYMERKWKQLDSIRLHCATSTDRRLKRIKRL